MGPQAAGALPRKKLLSVEPVDEDSDGGAEAPATKAWRSHPSQQPRARNLESSSGQLSSLRYLKRVQPPRDSLETVSTACSGAGGRLTAGSHRSASSVSSAGAPAAAAAPVAPGGDERPKSQQVQQRPQWQPPPAPGAEEEVWARENSSDDDSWELEFMLRASMDGMPAEHVVEHVLSRAAAAREAAAQAQAQVRAGRPPRMK